MNEELIHKKFNYVVNQIKIRLNEIMSSLEKQKKYIFKIDEYKVYTSSKKDNIIYFFSIGMDKLPDIKYDIITKKFVAFDKNSGKFRKGISNDFFW